MADFYRYRAKSALHHHNRKNLPYSTDLNLYTGCSHSCIYCYAAARRIQRTGRDCGKTGYKENITELLEKELYSEDFSRKIINIGGSTDSYQESERETGAMRDILRLLIKHRVPVIISTKSDLILRDIDLIRELSGLTYVNIAFSISTLNPDHSAIFEPGTHEPLRRIKALKEFSEAGINSALHFFPAIPFISDTEDMIESVVSSAADSGCRYLMPGFLYLTGNIRNVFFEKLKKRSPELEEKIRNVYVSGKLDKEVKYSFYAKLNKYAAKYGVETNYRKFTPENLIPPGRKNHKMEYSRTEGQLELF